jgi:hypothetical protein
MKRYKREVYTSPPEKRKRERQSASSTPLLLRFSLPLLLFIYFTPK